MKSVLMVLAIGALVLGSILTVGLLTEQNSAQPNVVYYDVPSPVPTQAQKQVAPETSAQSSLAVIQVSR